jgi:hypothetical protein
VVLAKAAEIAGALEREQLVVILRLVEWRVDAEARKAE